MVFHDGRCPPWRPPDQEAGVGTEEGGEEAGEVRERVGRGHGAVTLTGGGRCTYEPLAFGLKGGEPPEALVNQIEPHHS